MTAQYLALKAASLGTPSHVKVNPMWGVIYEYIATDEQILESGLHRRVAIPEKRARCREGNKFGCNGTVAYMIRRKDGLIDVKVHAYLVAAGDDKLQAMLANLPAVEVH
jgi:hypothetical protein